GRETACEISRARIGSRSRSDKQKEDRARSPRRSTYAGSLPSDEQRMTSARVRDLSQHPHAPPPRPFAMDPSQSAEGSLECLHLFTTLRSAVARVNAVNLHVTSESPWRRRI